MIMIMMMMVVMMMIMMMIMIMMMVMMTGGLLWVGEPLWRLDWTVSLLGKRESDLQNYHSHHDRRDDDDECLAFWQTMKILFE